MKKNVETRKEKAIDAHEQFLSFVFKHQPDLKAFIGAMVRDRHEREDVFQEAVLTLWRKFSTYDQDRSFGAWARGITANIIMRSYQTSKRRPALMSADVITAILDAYDRAEWNSSHHIDALQHCMEKINKKGRNLLTLRYAEGLKLDDLARRVGSTMHAVHKALARIRPGLQKCIEARLAAQ